MDPFDFYLYKHDFATDHLRDAAIVRNEAYEGKVANTTSLGFYIESIYHGYKAGNASLVFESMRILIDCLKKKQILPEETYFSCNTTEILKQILSDTDDPIAFNITNELAYYFMKRGGEKIIVDFTKQNIYSIYYEKMRVLNVNMKILIKSLTLITDNSIINQKIFLRTFNNDLLVFFEITSKEIYSQIYKLFIAVAKKRQLPKEVCEQLIYGFGDILSKEQTDLYLLALNGIYEAAQGNTTFWPQYFKKIDGPRLLSNLIISYNVEIIRRVSDIFILYTKKYFIIENEILGKIIDIVDLEIISNNYIELEAGGAILELYSCIFRNYLEQHRKDFLSFVESKIDIFMTLFFIYENGPFQSRIDATYCILRMYFDFDTSQKIKFLETYDVVELCDSMCNCNDEVVYIFIGLAIHSICMITFNQGIEYFAKFHERFVNLEIMNVVHQLADDYSKKCQPVYDTIERNFDFYKQGKNEPLEFEDLQSNFIIRACNT